MKGVPPGPAQDAAHAVAQAVYGRVPTAAATARYVARLSADPGEPGRLAALARCVFGNPFRPSAFDPAWRAPAAVGLALARYESRDFSAAAILADALEEAGCDAAAVLAHCRGPGPHVRGCWVVDLVLGKS